MLLWNSSCKRARHNHKEMPKPKNGNTSSGKAPSQLCAGTFRLSSACWWALAGGASFASCSSSTASSSRLFPGIFKILTAKSANQKCVRLCVCAIACVRAIACPSHAIACPSPSPAKVPKHRARAQCWQGSPSFRHNPRCRKQRIHPWIKEIEDPGAPSTRGRWSPQVKPRVRLGDRVKDLGDDILCQGDVVGLSRCVGRRLAVMSSQAYLGYWKYGPVKVRGSETIIRWRTSWERPIETSSEGGKGTALTLGRPDWTNNWWKGHRSRSAPSDGTPEGYMYGWWG